MGSIQTGDRTADDSTRWRSPAEPSPASSASPVHQCRADPDKRAGTPHPPARQRDVFQLSIAGKANEIFGPLSMNGRPIAPAISNDLWRLLRYAAVGTKIISSIRTPWHVQVNSRITECFAHHFPMPVLRHSWNATLVHSGSEQTNGI